VPLYTDVVDALGLWREQRDGIPELADARWLFSRLGRQRRDGSFPEAGGQLSTTAVIRIVRPIMLAAGVPAQQGHPHTLRHTFGRLYMSACGDELSRLQRIMGHTSPETTSRYVFHQDLELAAEHRRIERLQSDPLALGGIIGEHGRRAEAAARRAAISARQSQISLRASSSAIMRAMAVGSGRRLQE
jgi:integrase